MKLLKSKNKKSPYACRTCGKKKMRCGMKPDTETCQRCMDLGIECEKPTLQDTSSTSGAIRRNRKKACQACKDAKIRCEPSSTPGDPVCRVCREENIDCVFPGATRGATASGSSATASSSGQNASGSTVAAQPLALNTQAVSGYASSLSSGPNSPTSSWWETCMTPSPVRSDEEQEY